MINQSLYVPNSLLKMAHGKFVFEKDPKKKQLLKTILNTPNTKIIINIDGTGPTGKRKELNLDSSFFSLLPKTGNFILNISNFYKVNIYKTAAWSPENIECLEFNFSDIDLVDFDYLPFPPKTFPCIQNLILNLGNCPSDLLLYSQDLDNIKITQEKLSDYDLDYNSIRFYDIPYCSQIDLSNLSNLLNSEIHFDKISPSCKWIFPKNNTIDFVKKDWNDSDEMILMKLKAANTKETNEYLTSDFENLIDKSNDWAK